MKFGNLDSSRRVILVAEIGNNHEGNPEVAATMIRNAAETGVDAVKFQTFVPEHYSHQGDQARLERLRGFRLQPESYYQLRELAESLGLVLFSTPFDHESLEFVSKIAPVIKISSGDNTFYPLLEAAARCNKPIILSTGLASIADISKAVDLIEECWNDIGISSDLAILHCVASYPVIDEEANLAAISTLARSFPDHTIGYSDHTLGVQAAVMAIALGARIVEKHFTLDTNYSDFRDHKLSLDPKGMTELVRSVRAAEELLGSGEKTPRPSENDPTPFRRSIAASRSLPEGTRLQRDHLTWVRPGVGIPPGDEDQVLRRRLKRSFAVGEIILEDDLD